jgi:hypothetical protein
MLKDIRAFGGSDSHYRYHITSQEKPEEKSTISKSSLTENEDAAVSRSVLRKR